MTSIHQTRGAFTARFKVPDVFIAAKSVDSWPQNCFKVLLCADVLLRCAEDVDVDLLCFFVSCHEQVSTFQSERRLNFLSVDEKIASFHEMIVELQVNRCWKLIGSHPAYSLCSNVYLLRIGA